MTLRIRTTIQAASTRVRGVTARVRAASDGLDRLVDRLPASPYGGRTATAIVVAGALAIAASLALGLDPVGAVATYTALVVGPWVIEAGIVALGAMAGWLAWTRSAAVTEARQARGAATAAAAGLTSALLAVYAGVVDPVALWATMLGDVVLTGAVAGFAGVTGLVSAASTKVLGAGRKGVFAAGLGGALSGGFVAAAAVPTLTGAGAIGLTAISDNLIPVSVFAAAIVFFVTDSLANVGEFSASVAFALRLATVVGLSVVVASELFGLPVPFLVLGFGVGMGGVASG